ncbi:MAG: hypothetical protein RLZZ28_2362 [Bacteroidota bacterium]|jgi:superoxide dismutase
MENLGIGSKVNHPHYGRGVVVETAATFYIVWFKSTNTAKNIAKDYPDLTVSSSTAAEPADAQISLADIEQALDNILNQRLHEFQLVPMATKWNDGNLILQAKDNSLQSKEIPIEVFFHKIVMVRDRLRLIEQKINAHKGLTDAEKVDLQQYITASYGSLTTFNVLFKETIHQFKGSAKD